MSECATDKPKILLYALNQPGVILLQATGVIYQNQTGGYSCYQRCEEGAFVLLYNAFVDHQPLDRHLAQLFGFGYGVMSTAVADAIDSLLRQYDSAGLTVDRTHLKESEEAWVYVNIEPVEHGLFENFGSCKGVLTWANSD